MSTGRENAGYVLPERVRVLVCEALGSEAELEGRHGPFGEVSDVRPLKAWRQLACVQCEVQSEDEHLGERGERKTR